MIYRRGVTCEITAFEVPNPPTDPDSPNRKWLAIATSHVYDPNAKAPPLTPAQVPLAGETMRVIQGKGFADTEATALATALKALLFQLTAGGFSENHDVKLW